MGGVFTHLLKTHPIGIEYLEEQWDESDLDVEERSVPLLITIDMFTYAAYLYYWVIVFMNLSCTHVVLLLKFYSPSICISFHKNKNGVFEIKSKYLITQIPEKNQNSFF